jgi:hypothetical protein
VHAPLTSSSRLEKLLRRRGIAFTTCDTVDAYLVLSHHISKP